MRSSAFDRRARAPTRSQPLATATVSTTASLRCDRTHLPTPASGARAAHRHRSTYVPPVMNDASSDARNSARLATSSGVPEPAQRMTFHVARARRLWIGQSIEGGLQHRRIDRRRTNAVHANALLGELERERPRQRDDALPSTSSKPPFLARRRCPVIDDMLTMAPPPASRISGITARAQIHALPHVHAQHAIELLRRRLGQRAERRTSRHCSAAPSAGRTRGRVRSINRRDIFLP